MKIKTTGELESTCKGIFEKLSGLVSWKWDDRFELTLAEFKIKNSGAVQSIISKELDKNWDKNTISKAPEVIHKIVKKMGNLRDKQLLFSNDTEDEIMLFAAWWPWGDNETISIRIGAEYTNKLRAKEKLEIKKWFNV